MIETKPNEPIDRNVCPTLGHALAVSAATVDPNRVGALLETAHAVLAGLDPAAEMGFALAMGKLWGVHLNDQNGMKFDEDKNFGAENLRSAFNQIKVLKEHNFATLKPALRLLRLWKKRLTVTITLLLKSASKTETTKNSNATYSNSLWV